jgi:hypothetical protein
MKPGEKTMAPLQLRESDQGHVPPHLRLTVEVDPDLA